MNSYALSGDIGDVIFSLRACHALKESGIYYLNDRPFTKAWDKARLDALLPLIESQPYIESAMHGEAPEPTHDFTDFRRGGLPYMVNLSVIIARWVGVELPSDRHEPWLTAEPSPTTAGKVIIHRSPRYHNNQFPWRTLAEAYGDRMVAVGLPGEHQALEIELGRKVPLVETASYAELASLIAGADLFIGNQSSPHALAAGLGVPIIQETSSRPPDCIFPSKTTFHVADGFVSVDGVDYGTRSTTRLDPNTLPPGGWRYDGMKAASLNSLIRDVARVCGTTNEEAKDLIVEETTKLVRESHPTFQRTKSTDLLTHLEKINPKTLLLSKKVGVSFEK
jgi:hypothetical protein